MSRKAIDPVVKFFNGRLSTAAGRKVPKVVQIDGEYCAKLYNKQNGRCAYSGIKLTFDKSGDRKVRIPTNASIDRIDSTKGYIKGNVHIVSVMVNNMKSNIPHNKFKKLCKQIAENC